MSFSETIFLFFLALIIFGPKKLPEIARQVGKYLNEFKRASNEFRAQIEQEIAHLETEKPQILPPAKAPEGTASRSLNAGEKTATDSLMTLAPPAEAPAIAAASDPAVSEPAASATDSDSQPAPGATQAIATLEPVSAASPQSSQQESHA